MNTAPRDYSTHGHGPMPGIGMPHDRMARLAARRAFVELKASFLQAVRDLDGTRAEWLRRQLRRAEEPIDLWLLRAAVFDELDRHGDTTSQGWTGTLRRGLDTLFPDLGQVNLALAQ